MRISQTEMIYDALRMGPLTSALAFTRHGCVHLPRRIKDLKELGVLIETRSLSSVNRHGTTVHYNEYTIAGGVVPTSFVKAKKAKTSPLAPGMKFAAKVIRMADPKFKGSPGAIALVAAYRAELAK